MPDRIDHSSALSPAVALGSGSSRKRGALTLTTLAAVGAVLLLLAAVSGATVATDGRLIEPFGVLAVGTIALTGAGLIGLARMFSSVRRSSTCGRGGC